MPPNLDTARITFLSDLLKHCSPATFCFNDDPDRLMPDGSEMPVGYTIILYDSYDTRFTANTWEACIDLARAKVSLPIQQANPG